MKQLTVNAIQGTAYGQFGHFGKTLTIPSLSKPKRFNVCHRHASTIYRVLPVPYPFRQSVLNSQKTVVLSSVCAPLLSPLHAHAPHTSHLTPHLLCFCSQLHSTFFLTLLPSADALISSLTTTTTPKQTHATEA